MEIRISAEANVDTRLKAAMLAHARESYVMSGRIDAHADREERAGMILRDRPQVQEAKAKVEAAEEKASRACTAVDRHRDHEPTGVTAKFTGRHSRWEAALRDLEAAASEAGDGLQKAKDALRTTEDRHRPGAEQEAMENRKANADDRRHAADYRRLGDALSSGDPAFATTVRGMLNPARSPEIALKAMRPDKLLNAAREWEPPAAKPNPETLKALATLDIEAPRGFGR